MFENPRRGRQARNFTTNVPKILDLKSSSEQIFSQKLSLGAPDSGVLGILVSFEYVLHCHLHVLFGVDCQPESLDIWLVFTYFSFHLKRKNMHFP